MNTKIKAGQGPKCPICSHHANLRRDLPGAFLRDALTAYYGEEMPQSVPIDDFEIWKCANCMLEFAWPMQPGDGRFYSWITSQPDYYPENRWEIGSKYAN